MDEKNNIGINSFDDLTSFITDQYSKLTVTYGLQKPSPKFFEFVENSLIKYSELYDKPLERKIKRQIALMEAIETMPHGWIWKLFHWDLWQKIKQIPEFAPKEKKKRKDCKKEEQELEKEPQVLTPTVIKQTTYPEIRE